MTPLLRAGALLALLVGLGPLGCGAADRAARGTGGDGAHFLGPSTRWRVALSGFARDPRHPPLLELRVHRHRGRLTSEPIQLEEPRTLEFVPVVFGPVREGCRVDLHRVAAGSKRLLWSGPPRFASEEQSRDPLGRLLRPVQIDLAAAPGAAPFRLEWTSHGACRDVPSALARVAFRARPSARMPVLLVCSDTHRYDHAFGAASALMPRLRQLTREAVVYERAYSNASWTLPSIASTLTGINPRHHRTGVRVESGPQGDWEEGRRLPPGQFRVGWGEEYHVFTSHPEALVNLGGRLQRLGYETAAVVANTLYVGSGLLAEGFDLVVDANGLPGEGVNELALRVMERSNSRRPLFLLVHYMDVHEYLSWGRRDGDPTGPAEALPPDELRQRYARQVEQADLHLGRLLDAWHRRFDLDESLFAFYSDHGEHLREPGRPTERHGDSMDEVLLHVPLLIRYPRALGVPAVREHRVVSLVDLVPTLLDALGASVDGAVLHGVSLLRPEPPAAAERRIFADHQLSGDELASVRAGALKLLVNLSRGTNRLIDVAGVTSNAPERESVVEDPVRRGELEREFEAYRADAEAWSAELVTDRAIDATEFEERLRAIGYAN